MIPHDQDALIYPASSPETSTCANRTPSSHSIPSPCPAIYHFVDNFLPHPRMPCAFLRSPPTPLRLLQALTCSPPDPCILSSVLCKGIGNRSVYRSCQNPAIPPLCRTDVRPETLLPPVGSLATWSSADAMARAFPSLLQAVLRDSSKSTTAFSSAASP